MTKVVPLLLRLTAEIAKWFLTASKHWPLSLEMPHEDDSTLGNQQDLQEALKSACTRFRHPSPNKSIQ